MRGGVLHAFCHDQENAICLDLVLVFGCFLLTLVHASARISTHLLLPPPRSHRTPHVCAIRYWKYDYDARVFVDDGREPFSFPDFASVYAQGDDADATDDIWLTRTGFTAPTTLFLSTAKPSSAEPEVVKQLPSMYNADDLEVTQGEATSKDGTYTVLNR